MANPSTAPAIEDWRLTSAQDLVALQNQILANRDPDRPEIVVCHGSGCMANGSPRVTEALQAALSEAGIDAKVMPGIKTTGCQGFCSRGPLVLIRPQGLFYQQVRPKDVKEIVERTIMEGEPIERGQVRGTPGHGSMTEHPQVPTFHRPIRHPQRNRTETEGRLSGKPAWLRGKFGGGAGSRTPDTADMSRML